MICSVTTTRFTAIAIVVAFSAARRIWFPHFLLKNEEEKNLILNILLILSK